VLAFVLCAAMRLARFNVILEEENAPAWKKAFFTGMPTPAGACMILLPLAWSFEFGDEWLRIPQLIGVWTIFFAGLMVSRLPTYALKGRRVPRSWIVPIMALVGLIAAALVSNTWLTLGLIGVVYIISLPLSFYQFRKLQQSQVHE
jgi:CDP-diacylglycerol---serine O-phosphatidyltransferase